MARSELQLLLARPSARLDGRIRVASEARPHTVNRLSSLDSVNVFLLFLQRFASEPS